MSRPNKPGQIVDMSIRMVMIQTLIKPNHLVHSQLGPQHLLDHAFIAAGIAIGIEQALPGGDQPTGAIHVDRTAFEDKCMLPDTNPFFRRDRAGGLRIPRHDIFAAPAIEAEIERNQLGALLSHDGASIAKPNIAGRHTDKLHRGRSWPDRGTRRSLGFLRPAGHPHGLESTGHPDQLRDLASRGFEGAPPLLTEMGPAAPKRPLRGPLRGNEDRRGGHSRPMPQRWTKKKGGADAPPLISKLKIQALELVFHTKLDLPQRLLQVLNVRNAVGITQVAVLELSVNNLSPNDTTFILIACP